MLFESNPAEQLRVLEERIQQLEAEKAQLIAQNQALSSLASNSEDLFRSLIESMPHNVFAKDLAGHFIFANQHYCRTEGKSLEEILGKTDFELHPTELAQKYRSDDLTLMQEGRALSLIERHQPIGGNVSHVQVVKAPIYDKKGRVQGLLGVFWDITKHLEQEEQSQAQSLKLQLEKEKIRVLANFMRDAVHEFATPLSIMKTKLYLLERRNEKSHPKLLQQIESQVSILQELLSRLVILARLDTLSNLERKLIRLETVFTGLFSVPLVEGKQIRYQLDPAIGQLWLAPGDFSLALHELYLNAVQHSREKGTIKIRAWLQETELRISIEDEGEGIPADLLPHIFERFFRGDQAHSSRGLGLGLAIAKRVIELHGGKLEVETAPNIGSRFTIILPSALLNKSE